MYRETSREAYEKIKANGLLADLMFTVYETIVNHAEGLTIKETCMKLPHIPETSVSPCFARLEERGVITAMAKRPCSITGNNALNWVSTGNLPTKFEKKVRVKCPHCEGNGFIETQQGKFDV